MHSNRTARRRLRVALEGLEIRSLLTLAAYPAVIAAEAGLPLGAFDIPVALFRPDASDISPDRFAAVVDWGDGSPAESARVVAQCTPVADPSAPRGARSWRTDLLVEGRHTYANTGSFNVRVTLVGPGDSAVAVGRIDVAPRAPGTLQLTPEGPPLVIDPRPDGAIFRLAGLTDSDPRFDPAAYTVTIDWGDHTPPSRGEVSPWIAYDGPPIAPGPDGFIHPDTLGYSRFDVHGTHAYALDAAPTSILVTVERPGAPAVSVVIAKPPADTPPAARSTDADPAPTVTPAAVAAPASNTPTAASHHRRRKIVKGKHHPQPPHRIRHLVRSAQTRKHNRQ